MQQKQPLCDDCAKHEPPFRRFFILFQPYVIHLLNKLYKALNPQKDLLNTSELETTVTYIIHSLIIS